MNVHTTQVKGVLRRVLALQGANLVELCRICTVSVVRSEEVKIWPVGN
jgi:hypothetical protein